MFKDQLPPEIFWNLQTGESEDTTPVSLCRTAQQYIRECTAAGNFED
jgi:hypothetical protein